MKSFSEYLTEAMAVDAVNTNPGQKEVVVLQGRFQPPTAGHLKAIKAAYSKYHLPIIIVMIKGSKSNVQFDNKIQEALFKKMLKGIPYQIIELTNGFIGEWIDYLRNKNMEPKALFTGSDRKKSYEGQINRYKEKWNLSLKVEEIARTDEDISATKVRKALADDDFNTFKKMMDKSVWKDFDTLKKYV